MKKHLTLLASFVIMLCIGSVYAWSIIAAELIEHYDFSGSQSQVIFGAVIAIFPVTMILAGRISNRIKHRYYGFISGLLFFLGYLLASHSQGNFIVMLTGVGLLAGIATGFGYWMALTTPVQWFPDRKGLVTGIAAAGFGLGAVFMSLIAERILDSGRDVLQLLKIIGISYGLIIFVLSNLIYQAPGAPGIQLERIKATPFIRTPIFRKLFLGIFLGTFAGLLIIGSLRIIGGQYDISNHNLVLGVSLFAMANFSGRLTWGFLSDHWGASISIFSALLLQALAIVALNLFTLTDISYMILSVLIGFGFGGNFVLFAKESAQVFGLQNLGIIYPYVFIGYAIAGFAGPLSGGFLYDLTGSYTNAIYLASGISLLGSLLFLDHFIKLKRNEPVKQS
ncbi:MAG: MFS transporter [Bacteroidota bacterium]